jgi:hypothetical protein
MLNAGRAQYAAGWAGHHAATHRARKRNTPGTEAQHAGHAGTLDARAGGPPGADLGEDLVAERIDAGASG